MSRPWTVGDKRIETMDDGYREQRKLISKSTNDLHRPSYPRKSSTPSTSESLLARPCHEPPPPLPPPHPLGCSPGRSIATLPRAAAAPIDVCVVLIGAAPIPLQRPRVVLASGVILSIDTLSTELVLLVQRLFAFCCCTTAPNSGGYWATAFLRFH